MQAEYPKKLPTIYWDPLRVEYPVRKFPETEVSSETIGHQWRGQPEILQNLKDPAEEIKEYMRDYNVTKELTRSQTSLDFGFKLPETKRFNKHTSCTENHYIYPPSRKLADRPPQITAHGTTEMRSAYTEPITPARLVTDKDQFKHPASLPLDPPAVEPSWHKELEPIDTTYDGYEKYLDPYLTTSRLHHRPYTAEQQRRSSARDTVTYYTYKDISWTRTPKPEIDEWHLPLKIPKSMYDREKFKQDLREIRTHNKLNWTPGTFRTECRDNYVRQTSRPESKIHNDEENVRSYYKHYLANLPTNTDLEYSTIKATYTTENSHVGSSKPLCSVVDQYIAKNKRLERKSMHIA